VLGRMPGKEHNQDGWMDGLAGWTHKDVPRGRIHGVRSGKRGANGGDIHDRDTYRERRVRSRPFVGTTQRRTGGFHGEQTHEASIQERGYRWSNRESCF